MSKMSFIKEFWDFLKTRKRYWLAPVVFILFFLGVIIIFFSPNAAVAPFIYTLF